MRRTGRLRHRSKTNSRPHENKQLREWYREGNWRCEGGPKMCRSGLHNGEHIHHIAHQTGRWDVVGNLIHLCQRAHDFCHAKPVDGMVLCLHAKLLKGELSDADFRKASVKSLCGWLESVRDRVNVAAAEFESLVEWCES